MFYFVSYLSVATHLVFSVRWRFIHLLCWLSRTYFLLASVSLERWPESDQSVQVCRLIASIFNWSYISGGGVTSKPLNYYCNTFHLQGREGQLNDYMRKPRVSWEEHLRYHFIRQKAIISATLFQETDVCNEHEGVSMNVIKCHLVKSVISNGGDG